MLWKPPNNLNKAMEISNFNLMAKGIELNCITYQRLISRFYNEGVIEGTTKILKNMCEKQLSVYDIRIFTCRVSIDRI